HQNSLALECGRARNPVPLGQHAHNFRMRMLGYLPHQRLAVGIGHPVFGFYTHAVVDALLELAFRTTELICRANPAYAGINELGIHNSLLSSGGLAFVRKDAATLVVY